MSLRCLKIYHTEGIAKRIVGKLSGSFFGNSPEGGKLDTALSER